MSEAKTMIQQNNQLRERLTTENKAYYEELLTYIRLNNWLKDEREVEERLLEILQDTIAAQEDGISAYDYFGKEPKEAADEVLSHISTSWTEGWKLIGILFGISTLIPVMFELSTGKNTIDLLNLIVKLLVISTSVLICLTIIKNGLFKKGKAKSIYESVLISLTFIGAITVLVITPRIVPDIGIVTLSDEVALSLVMIIALGITWKVCTLTKNERLIWSGVLPIVWFLFLLAVLNYFPVTSAWVGSTMGRIVVGVGLVLGIAANYQIGFSAMKKEERTKKEEDLNE